MDGWIKLHRKFVDWEWFSKPEMVKLFLYLLLSVNYEEKKWQGETILPGQIITSYERLSAETNLSVQTIRTCINRLKSTNEITTKSTSHYTIITICNYEFYQTGSEESNKQNNTPNNDQITSQQQTTNKQLTTTKEINKEINKEEYIGKIQNEFYQSLIPFVSEFGKEMIREFYDYWSEPNKSQTKIRYQLEKTWDTHMRLLRWKKNNFKKGGLEATKDKVMQKVEFEKNW
jgi:hypothetical protein